MKKLIVLGITGGVGAGKSTVLQYLRDKYHAVIIMADFVAKKLMERGGETYQAILTEFGEDLLDSTGEIDKTLLAARLFERGYGTERINEIVHPAVVRHVKNRIEQAYLEMMIERGNAPKLVVIEAALLFEGQADTLCDEIWYIHTDKEERIERLMQSREYSREKCLGIMENQMSEEQFRAKCSFTLDNGQELSEVYRAIDERMQELLSL